MPRLLLKCLIGACAFVTIVAHAQAPKHIGRRVSTPEDIAAITAVTEEFQAAVIGKNAKKLSALLLNSHILFSSPASPQQTRAVNEKYDGNFDGIYGGGFGDFYAYLVKQTVPTEEKFYNTTITQDGHIAWVMFDYEFLKDNKVQNYGVETWQMIKTADEKWKIASVVWSLHMPPAQ